MEIVTRFAPSPTGYIHIGNVRSAIYPYLLARQKNGKMILRIEDTDRARYVARIRPTLPTNILDVCAVLNAFAEIYNQSL